MGIYFTAQLPSVQTYLTQQIAKQVSDNLNAKFEVGRVDIIFFNRILLRDIYIEDRDGNTLLQSDWLSATIQSLRRAKKNIVFNQIIMQNARINLRKDADSVLNLKFIIDALTIDDTTRTKWDFEVNAIHLKNSSLSYKQHLPVTNDSGINFQDIELTRMNLLANRIYTTADSLHLNIRYLNFKEKSGFSVDHYTSESSISATGINLRKLRIVTPGSRLDLDNLSLDFRSFKDFNDFASLVSINSRFNPSLISFADLNYFAPGLKDIDMELTMSGTFTGKVNNLKGKNVNITGYGETSVMADFNMVGLPDFSDTFIFLDLHNFRSSAGDILTISESFNENRKNNIPLNISALGKINYRGKFTGFIDDFVAYGELNSGLGTIITDLALQPDPDNVLNFAGRLNVIHFDAGPLAETDKIGRITFNTELKGQVSAQSGINADLDGIIDSVQLFDYSYRHIQLAGELADKRFSGSAYINDPNIVLEFLGSINLSEDIPEFDFSANVSGARLYDLNLEEEDQSLMLSFLSTANFKGNNIDNLNGSIRLVNTVFEKNDHIFSLENASLEALGDSEQREVILLSDIADARITGNYEFATFTSSFIQFIQDYIPSYSSEANSTPEVTDNNFTFSLHLKETDDFTQFFTPEFSVSDNTKIEGIYNPSEYVTEIRGSARKVILSNNILTNITIDALSGDQSFNVNSGIGHALIGNRFEIENIKLTSLIKNDSISFMTIWDNKEKIAYNGNITAAARFMKNPAGKLPITDIDLLPSSITIADSVWHISKSKIRVDSTSYTVDNFIFGMNGQSFKATGRISEDPGDSLHFEFIDLDIKNIELITSFANFDFTGIIDGNASLSDVYNVPLFKTDLRVQELFLNSQDYGDLTIFSQWDQNNQSISVHAFSDRGTDRIINIEGRYFPEGSLLDFDIALNKINLRTFDGYLDEVFADIRGLATGKLNLEGNIRKPFFNGNLSLQKTSFVVDYLKSRYNFTHDIYIENNNIVFSDLTLYDANHNICRVSGQLSSTYFNDFNLDLYLYPDNFMVLNTLERDNELFYGRVIASGLAHISGPVNNIMMNISAQTNRNTRFFIPLQKSNEVGELHFLNFTDSHSTDKNEEHETREYEVDLSGIQLNFDLDVTPDAEMQIIFDSKIGDIIRGRGNGSFKMEINTLGQFNMFGEYTIEQGDYLFTLQNVINKRFEIEQGGRIMWNGDPFDANIDLKAVYRLRSSLNPLMAAYSNGTNDMYSRRIPVECQIIMREKLMTPDISFEIELPTADPDTRRNVSGVLNNQEKINRQFLSLLIINNFLPEQDMADTGMAGSLGLSATEASITTVSEFFSNQLSNWLSQLSRDVDFGVNWRPGDDITSDEVELALSTELLNDRVSINGHVDVGGRQTNTSNIVGDFDVDIKLNQSGKLRLKAFTRANDNLIRPHLSPYTQGIGLFYRDDFDSFDELMKRYWSMITSSGKKENE